MPVWTCSIAIVAAVFALPVVYAALTRKPRPPASVRGGPRDTPTQAFWNADARARVEVICASFSFAFALATIVLLVSGRPTVSSLTWVYIAAGVYEAVGVLVTVDAILDTGEGLGFMPTGWAKWRGPAFIIGGIILGCLGNIQSAHMQEVPPRFAAPVVGGVA